jgi:hypothetical protein
MSKSHLIFKNLISIDRRDPNRVLKPLVPNKYSHLSLVVLLPPSYQNAPEGRGRDGWAIAYPRQNAACSNFITTVNFE